MIKVLCERFRDSDLKTIIEDWSEGRTELVLEVDEYNALRRACWEYLINNTEEEICGFISFVRENEIFEQDYYDTQVIDYDIYKGISDEIQIYKCPLIEDTYYGLRCIEGRYGSEYETEFIEVGLRPVMKVEWCEVC
jgi:hypothetical protein